jgi:hypothetical protein
MFEATKIIPFPGRAKPHELAPHQRFIEFAELSEIIWSEHAGDNVERLVLPVSAADKAFPNRPV